MTQPPGLGMQSSSHSPARARLLLTILCAVQFVDAYDIAAMGPALPKIQNDLHMSPSSLQWVVTAYVLGYGGFLLVGGRLADLFKRKELLIGSMLVFIVASLVGGFATVGAVLIGARLAKGISAAFTAPVSLAILLYTYDDEEQRNKALGTYLSIAAVGFTSGLVLGGIFASANWRLVLFIPAGLAVIVTLIAMRVVPGTDHRAGDTRQRVDLPGAVTVTLGLIALVYGVSRGSTNGWGDSLTIIALVAAVVLLLAFLQIERLLRTPLLPLSIFRRPGLLSANAAMFLLQGSYVGWQYMATLYLQDVRGWSPVMVGLVFAPSGIVIVLTAQRWAGRVMKSGAWPLATIGIILETVGYLWSLEFGHVNVVLVFAGATLIMGIGYAMAYPATNITAVSSARADEQGLASGLFIAAFQIGSGVILGVVTSVFISVGHTANAGLSPYRAGILASVGASVLGVAICVAQLIHMRRSAVGGVKQSASVAEPVAFEEEPSS